jgi:UDP-N-acetylmuramoylalanine--D-glutamate ligase
MAAAADADHGVPEGVATVTFSCAAGAAADGIDYYVTSDGGLAGPDGAEFLPVAELPRSLPLDVANSLAAAATARAAGASVEGCRAALRRFPGLPHRVQLVAEHHGVRWYDDSKSTTPASVLAAVAGFTSVVLIAGGRNKGLDLGVLGRTAPPVRRVVAIGDAAAEVEAAFSGLVPVTRAASMAAAVSSAAELAEPGDVVLLSPGCASFDWYHSYAERGEEFTALVTALASHDRVETEGSPA